MSPTDFPEPPDPDRLAEVRAHLSASKARRQSEDAAKRRRFGGRINGEQIRSGGTYTLIPALLLAGPAVGYGLGWVIQHRWGGEPWWGVGGTLVGLVAAFRQIFLILAGKTAPPVK